MLILLMPKADEIVSSCLDRLIISIDGLTQKTYEQYRVNGNLKIEASKLLVESKGKSVQIHLHHFSIFGRKIK